MKVVALTVEHQNSADQERRRHKSCFSADQTRAAEVLLLRKPRSIRAAGNEQLQVQRRAALTSPLLPIGPSEAVISRKSEAPRLLTLCGRCWDTV